MSLISPAHNAEKTLGECLKACLGQTLKAREVIVVDDGSTDGTADVAQSFPVRYVHQENAGPAAARNRGAREATGDIVVFTDADCVPEPDWLQQLAAGFADGVVAVGGTYGIANPSSLLARIVHAEIVVRHKRLPREVDFLGSFNVAYRKDTFDAVGSFDESFRYASGEDNDLAYRLAQTKGKMRFVPTAKVAHYHPECLWRYLRTQWRHGYWRMRLYARHPGKMSGDNYAGLGDLSGPPLSILALCAAAIGLLPVSALRPVCLTAASFLVALLIVMRLPMAYRMIQVSRDGSMVLFPLLATLRDMARGMGMIQGTWRFLVRRKNT